MIYFYNANKLDTITLPKLDSAGNWFKPWTSKVELSLTLICITMLTFWFLTKCSMQPAVPPSSAEQIASSLHHSLFESSSEEGYLSWDMWQLWIQFQDLLDCAWYMTGVGAYLLNMCRQKTDIDSFIILTKLALTWCLQFMLNSSFVRLTIY